MSGHFNILENIKDAKKCEHVNTLKQFAINYSSSQILRAFGKFEVLNRYFFF